MKPKFEIMKITKHDILRLRKERGVSLYQAQKLLEWQTMEHALRQVDDLIHQSEADPSLRQAVLGMNVILKHLIQQQKRDWDPQ